MSLGDSIEVTYMIGAGKTDRETVEAKAPGGMVVLNVGEEVPPGLIFVTEYSRKGIKRQRLVVSQAAFVAAVERKRR